MTPNAASKIYGSSDPALTGTTTGFLPADGVTATYTRTAGETVTGGPYTISATLDPSGVLSNYTITYNTAAFTINPAPASVTPNAAGKVYGQSDPAFTGSLVGFLPADNVTATYSRTTGEGVGSYTISATLNTSGLQHRGLDRLGKRPLSLGGVLDNYSITYNTATFTITAAVLTVTANDATIPDGSPLPTFTASYSGFQCRRRSGSVEWKPESDDDGPAKPARRQLPDQCGARHALGGQLYLHLRAAGP